MSLDYLNWIAMVLRYMDTQECLYMPYWLYYSLQNFPLFWYHTWKYNIQASKRLTKVKEKWSTIQYDVFAIFHFLPSNVPDNMCHKYKWQMQFFTCVRLVPHILVFAHAIACIKWRWLHLMGFEETTFRF